MDPFVPQTAEVLENKRETKNIFNLRLRFTDRNTQRGFRFLPGQFNMLYAFGAGEAAISIASDPDESDHLDHIIREVGVVTHQLAGLKKGDTVGIRGPFGRGWPLEETKGRDLIFITGGLGCAPARGAIEYALKRRNDYGAIKILHGIKTPKDLIYQQTFRKWAKFPDTEVLLSSDEGAKNWKYSIGVVTNLLDAVRLDAKNTIAMICGPEIMMRFTVKGLMKQGVAPSQIFLSLERNMKCALGFCGHCQYGPEFICKDGPVLSYDRIQHLFSIKEV